MARTRNKEYNEMVVRLVAKQGIVKTAKQLKRARSSISEMYKRYAKEFGYPQRDLRKSSDIVK